MFKQCVNNNYMIKYEMISCILKDFLNDKGLLRCIGLDEFEEDEQAAMLCNALNAVAIGVRERIKV